MKKNCICVNTWRWGTVDKRIVYGIATMFFALGLMLDTWNNWDKPCDTDRMVLVTFNLFGFLGMLVFQLLNKWIIGVINVTFIVLLSMVPFTRAIHNYKPSN